MWWLALQLQDAAWAAETPVDPDLALAWWALRFTPCVVRLDEAVLMEVSASERLFGGRMALLAVLQNAAKSPVDGFALHFALRIACGPTALAALGRLRAAAPDAEPNALPCDALTAARPHGETLRNLGCQNWGHLRALPRAGLARRLGSPLLDALDRAYGDRPDPYVWLQLQPVFEMSLELPTAVESAPALLFGAQRLLAQLLAWLQSRQLGVLAMEWSWELDARRANVQHHDAHHDGSGTGRLCLRTAQPSRERAHLQRLLTEHLGHVQLPAPVGYLRLRTLETQAMRGVSASLLPDTSVTGHTQHQFAERLMARLGTANVRGVQMLDSHLPEAMQVSKTWSITGGTQAVKRTVAPAASCCLEARLLPTWLLTTPQPLTVHADGPHYQGRLQILSGPRRLESGWLEAAPALRDYFVARSPQAGVLWVFRDRLRGDGVRDGLREGRPQWFLHGFFA